MKKVLSVVMFLSGCMPLMLGITSLVAYPKAIEMMKLSDSPDVFQAMTVIAVCMLSLAVMQFIAGYWVWVNNWSGVVFSRWAGALIVMSGIVLYTVLHRADIGIPDMAKGTLILILSFMVKRDK